MSKQNKILSDEAERAIIETFSYHMEEIGNCVGGKTYHLHQAIVSAVERGVESGIYRATKEYYEYRASRSENGETPHV